MYVISTRPKIQEKALGSNKMRKKLRKELRNVKDAVVTEKRKLSDDLGRMTRKLKIVNAEQDKRSSNCLVAIPKFRSPIDQSKSVWPRFVDNVHVGLNAIDGITI